MATKLNGSVVIREVKGLDGRTYIVKLTSGGIIIGEKREHHRTHFYGPLPYHQEHIRAAKLVADANLADKQKTRRPRVTRNLLKIGG